MTSSNSEKLERLLRLPAVEEFTGLKRSSIYVGVKDGTFPRPIRLSARAVAWREGDLIRWQASRQSTGGQ